MAFAPANSYGGGIFQWTLGQSYKTSLGGNFSTSIGQNSAVSVAAESKFTLGTTNSVKYAWETSVSFGKSFSYKDVDEIEFKPSGISIAEYSGARCLDLFQASAGLGPIQLAHFEAQRSAARTAMKILVICNGASAIANILMGGFGQGFAEQGKTDQQSHYALEIGIAVTAAQALTAIIPVVMLLCNSFLTAAKAGTKPTIWQPNAIFQASSTKGVFIGNKPNSIGIKEISMMAMNEEGTNVTVFNAPNAILSGENIGFLDKEEHINSFLIPPGVRESTMQMTGKSVDIKTSSLTLNGKTPAIALISPVSTLKAFFSNVDLTAQTLPGSKAAMNASLVLDDRGPKAILAAQAGPASSSVDIIPTALKLKSGVPTELVLNSTSLNMKAPALKLEAVGAVEINCTQFKVNGAGGFSVLSALIRLG